MRLNFATEMVLALSMTGVAVGAESEPWFGVDLPEAREARSARQPAVYTEHDFPPLGLPTMADDAAYRDIPPADLSAALKEIITFSGCEHLISLQR